MHINKQISVIIVTYKSEKDIFDCLASLYRYNDIGNQLEVIIVDNNTPDFEGTRLQLQHSYPEVKIVINSQNGGYGQGNNVGIAMASAPLIAVMNPDVRLMMPLFQSIISMFDKQPQLGMVGCQQMQNPSKPGMSFQHIANSSGFAKCVLALLYNKWGHYDYKHMYLSGAFFFCRKDLMEAIGGFDEHIFMYAEEDDIRFRMLQQNPKLQFAFRRDLMYIHPTDNRIFSESREKRQIEANIYVVGKQGVSPKKYLTSEIKRYRWNIMILFLFGHFQSVSILKKSLRILLQMRCQYK